MLALSDAFREQRFTQLDFTEGEDEHKRLFSTHSVPSANVFYLRRNVLSKVLVLSHGLLDWVGNTAVLAAKKLHLKSYLRRRLRRSA